MSDDMFGNTLKTTNPVEQPVEQPSDLNALSGGLSLRDNYQVKLDEFYKIVNGVSDFGIEFAFKFLKDSTDEAFKQYLIESGEITSLVNRTIIDSIAKRGFHHTISGIGNVINNAFGDKINCTDIFNNEVIKNTIADYLCKFFDEHRSDGNQTIDYNNCRRNTQASIINDIYFGIPFPEGDPNHIFGRPDVQEHLVNYVLKCIDEHDFSEAGWTIRRVQNTCGEIKYNNRYNKFLHKSGLLDAVLNKFEDAMKNGYLYEAANISEFIRKYYGKYGEKKLRGLRSDESLQNSLVLKNLTYKCSALGGFEPINETLERIFPPNEVKEILNRSEIITAYAKLLIHAAKEGKYLPWDGNDRCWNRSISSFDEHIYREVGVANFFSKEEIIPVIKEGFNQFISENDIQAVNRLLTYLRSSCGKEKLDEFLSYFKEQFNSEEFINSVINNAIKCHTETWHWNRGSGGETKLEFNFSDAVNYIDKELLERALHSETTFKIIAFEISLSFCLSPRWRDHSFSFRALDGLYTLEERNKMVPISDLKKELTGAIENTSNGLDHLGYIVRMLNKIASVPITLNREDVSQAITASVTKLEKNGHTEQAEKVRKFFNQNGLKI